MSNFNNKLEKILKKDTRFLDQDGDLIKSEVVDKAWKVDKDLIELLLEDKDVKTKFFSEIKGHWIFNVTFFVDFVQDKNFLNDSYTKFKNKIGLTIDKKYLNQRSEVALAWPYKDCVLEGGMGDEETKRNEIFFNEVLAQDEIDRLYDPKVLTNFKRYTKKGEERLKEIKRNEGGNIEDNIVIKGNNLIAVHSLKKEFAGKVKLIYIDPPYNTGNDSFLYNDRFNHSTWLTFMKNRLEAAKELLREDGAIFVHCDDNEHAYLKVLMDEVFGRENFRNNILTRRFDKNLNTQFVKNGLKTLNTGCDYVLVYSKSESTKLYPVYRESSEKRKNQGYWKGFWNSPDRPTMRYPIMGVEIEAGQWKWEKTKANEAIKNYEEYQEKFAKKYSLEEYWENTGKEKKFIRKNPNGASSGKNKGIEHWVAPSEGSLRTSNWTDILTTETNPIVKFSSPKAENLIYELLKLATEEGDIVLDFFVGSGTTAAVAHKTGRQYIAIEQMDYIHEVTIPRLSKVIEGEQGGISKGENWKGGGEFVYFELKTYNQDFVDRIQAAKKTKDLEGIWDDMKQKSFLNWNVDFRNADLAFDEWKELDFEKQQHALIQLLNKNQLYVNLSEADDKSMKCSEEEKKLSAEFYNQSS